MLIITAEEMCKESENDKRVEEREGGRKDVNCLRVRGSE